MFPINPQTSFFIAEIWQLIAYLSLIKVSHLCKSQISIFVVVYASFLQLLMLLMEQTSSKKRSLIILFTRHASIQSPKFFFPSISHLRILPPCLANRGLNIGHHDTRFTSPIPRKYYPPWTTSSKASHMFDKFGIGPEKFRPALTIIVRLH